LVEKRVLCLGIGREDGRYDYAKPDEDAPTIFDYDIVIVNTDGVDGAFVYYKREQFTRFFKNSGICFAVSSPNTIFRYSPLNLTTTSSLYCTYGFLPSGDKEIATKKVQGKVVKCIYEEAKWIFDSVQFYWSCYFTKVPKNSRVLATNKVGDPVSLVTPYEAGYCVFLPQTYYLTRLVDLLLENGLSLIPDFVEIEVPEWIGEYATPLESQLLRQKLEIEKRLGKTGKYKPLLYETGTSLENLVIDAFGEIGLDVSRLPEGSHADFEFPISEELTSVCEVKGLMESANVRHLRQLLQYYIEQRDIEQRNVRAVFIVNHFRDKNPRDRGEPLTKDASELVEKHDFRVITTVELYDFITKLLEDKLDKEEFLKRFLH